MRSTGAVVIYLRKQIVFIPTLAIAGAFVHDEPLAAVDIDDSTQIKSEIVKRLKGGHRMVDRSEWKSIPKDGMLKRAEVRSWKEFGKGASNWLIEKFPDFSFIIWHQRPEAKGRGWLPDPEHKIVFDPGTLETDVAEVMTKLVKDVYTKHDNL